MSGLAFAQAGLWVLFYWAIFALSAWALIDCAVRPARAYPAAGKRTKAFWLAITAVAAVVAFLSLPLLSGLPFPQFLALLSVVAAIVYLVDVRPAVAPYSRRRGGGGRGSAGSSRGGW